MARGKICKIIFNTRNGYCLTPIKCASLAEADRLAREKEMAFRIYVGSKCIKHGWYVS